MSEKQLESYLEWLASVLKKATVKISENVICGCGEICGEQLLHTGWRQICVCLHHFNGFECTNFMKHREPKGLPSIYISREIHRCMQGRRGKVALLYDTSRNTFYMFCIQIFYRNCLFLHLYFQSVSGKLLLMNRHSTKYNPNLRRNRQAVLSCLEPGASTILRLLLCYSMTEV